MLTDLPLVSKIMLDLMLTALQTVNGYHRLSDFLF